VPLLYAWTSSHPYGVLRTSSPTCDSVYHDQLGTLFHVWMAFHSWLDPRLGGALRSIPCLLPHCSVHESGQGRSQKTWGTERHTWQNSGTSPNRTATGWINMEARYGLLTTQIDHNKMVMSRYSRSNHHIPSQSIPSHSFTPLIPIRHLHPLSKSIISILYGEI
jgi:hypothetical protein